MSDENPQIAGPVMLAATNMMRPPPTRVGKIGKDFVLPRTVPLMGLIAGAVGLFVGLLFALPFASFEGFTIGGIAGAALGVAVVTMSPIKGESFAKWLGLTTSALRAQKVEINGRAAKVYIGIAPLSYTAAGVIRVRPGAAEVALGSVDERGVLIPQSQIMAERRSQANQIASSRGHSWQPSVETRPLPAQGKNTLDSLRKDKSKKESRSPRSAPLSANAPAGAPQVPKQGYQASGQPQQGYTSPPMDYQPQTGVSSPQMVYQPQQAAAQAPPVQPPNSRDSRKGPRLTASKSKPLTPRK